MNSYIKGDDVLFYIMVDNVYEPVSCLIDNPLQESTDVIETTARGSGGFRSYIPGIQDYSININANMVIDDGFISYDYIKKLKRDLEVFNWKIASLDGNILDKGAAFISELSMTNSTQEIVSFNATLTPYTKGILSNIDFNVSANGYEGVDILKIEAKGDISPVDVIISGNIYVFETALSYPFEIEILAGQGGGSQDLSMPISYADTYEIENLIITPSTINGNVVNLSNGGVMIYPEIVLSARHENGGTLGWVKLDAGDVQLTGDITATGNIGLYVFGDPPETPTWQLIPFSVTLPKNTNSVEYPLPNFHADDTAAIPRIQDVVFNPTSVDSRNTKVITDVELYDIPLLSPVVLSGSWYNADDTGEVRLNTGDAFSQDIVVEGNITIVYLADSSQQSFPFSIQLDQGDTSMTDALFGSYADDVDYQVSFTDVTFSPSSTEGRETEITNPLTWA